MSVTSKVTICGYKTSSLPEVAAIFESFDDAGYILLIEYATDRAFSYVMPPEVRKASDEMRVSEGMYAMAMEVSNDAKPSVLFKFWAKLAEGELVQVNIRYNGSTAPFKATYVEAKKNKAAHWVSNQGVKQAFKGKAINYVTSFTYLLDDDPFAIQAYVENSMRELGKL